MNEEQFITTENLPITSPKQFTDKTSTEGNIQKHYEVYSAKMSSVKDDKQKKIETVDIHVGRPQNLSFQLRLINV